MTYARKYCIIITEQKIRKERSIIKKIRKIKKTTAVISAAAIFAAMTSCGSTEAPKPAEEKQSAATTQSAITEQETQPIIEDTANGERETIGFERTADNEITTAEYQGTKINAGETAQSTVERTLEEGWSEGDAELWLRVQTDPDCAYDYAGEETGFEFKI